MCLNVLEFGNHHIKGKRTRSIGQSANCKQLVNLFDEIISSESAINMKISIASVFIISSILFSFVNNYAQADKGLLGGLGDLLTGDKSHGHRHRYRKQDKGLLGGVKDLLVGDHDNGPRNRHRFRGSWNRNRRIYNRHGYNGHLFNRYRSRGSGLRFGGDSLRRIRYLLDGLRRYNGWNTDGKILIQIMSH